MTIPIIVISIAVFMIACELARPGRPWPKVANWWWRAILLNAVQVSIVYGAGMTWDRWMSAHRPWSAEGLGVVGGAIVV